MVVWLIGLSGSGKTTLANEIVKNINKKNRNTILIDGDMIREIFNNDLGYSMDDEVRKGFSPLFGDKFRDYLGSTYELLQNKASPF